MSRALRTTLSVLARSDGPAVTSVGPARRSRAVVRPLIVAALALALLALAAAPALGSVGHSYLCQITGTSPGSASECHTGGSATAGGLVAPFGLALSSGNLWVADPGNAAVDEFDSSGAAVFQQTGGAASFSPGGVSSVAVNDATQFSYVGDWASGVVDVFDNTGALVTQWNGSTTPSGSFGGLVVNTAVDNSIGPSSGDVYVADFNDARVDKLDPSGNPVSFSGSAGYISGSQLTGTPSGGFQNLQGIAADASGNIYVINDAGSGLDVVDEFDQTGTFVRQFSGTPAGPFGFLTGVAVNAANGHVYVADRDNHVVDEFDSSGTFVSQVTGDDTPAGSFSTFNGSSGGIDGVAVDASGGVYVSDSGNHVVDRFSPDVILADVSTGQASNLQQTSATVGGTVNPDGVAITSCRFEYGTDTSYGQSVPCSPTPAQIGSGTSPVAVSANITGLQAGTIYHFRLDAGNADGTTKGQDQTFETVGLGFGITSFDGSLSNQDGSTDTQAGSHPFEATTSFSFTTVQHLSAGTVNEVPDENVKDVTINLPAGFIGNPTGIPQCQQQDLRSDPNRPDGTDCPLNSQIGVETLQQSQNQSLSTFPVFNMAPPPGEPAQFGFEVGNAGVYIDLHVRAGGDYGVTATLSDISVIQPFIGSSLTLWGVPADPAHDPQRGATCNGNACNGGGNSVGGAPVPFLTLPTSCAGPQTTTMSADSWQHPGDFKTASFVSHDSAGNPVGNDGCNLLPFSPSITVQPDTSSADSPSGLHVDLHLPQDGLEQATGLATADLKSAVVALPAGTSVNPSSANGLAACSPAQIALSSPDPATCPDASKLGTVEVDTPLLDHPVTGGVYLAAQNNNPFGSLLAIYIAVDDPVSGIVIKLAGHVVPDPATGRLETTFDNNPQLPFTDFKLDFFGGPRAALATPVTCGSFQTTSQMVPWSAVDPNNPQPGEIATPSDTFQINSGPNGSACVSDPSQRPLSPGFSAGTVFNGGGSYSPFVLKLTRQDGEQNLTGLDTTLPPGLLGKLAGIPECSDAALASISQAEGSGANEQANPACPAGSQLGGSNVGAGAGASPMFVGGKVYLAGPYKGAPYSIAIVTPALAGPFDLGSIVVRAALYVDPSTAQITARSDPIPTIVHGIPLRIRDIRIKLDRPNFTLNPTSCDPMAVTGTAFGSDGAQAALTDHYQASGCGALPFAPKFSASILNGSQGIHRSDHPNLVFNLHANPGDANVRMAQVLLPSSFQIDQANLGNICSETELASTRCAGRNTVGTATATTPLLDYQLSGPVYAVSGSGGLPKLAVILNGPPTQPVQLILRGVTTTIGNRIANTFATVPDAPVTDFSLSLKGGPSGYLVDNTDVCAGAKGRSKKARKKANRLRKTNLTADALVDGQNGKTADQTVPISAACGKAKKKKSRHAHHKHH